MLTKVPDAMLVNGGGAKAYANRSLMKQAKVSENRAFTLWEPGREGGFFWKEGNFSALCAADAQEGIYAAHDTIPSTSGAFVRHTSGLVYPKWFAPPAYPGNASPMFKSIIDLINIDYSKHRKVIVDGFYNLQTELPTINGYGTIFESDGRSGHGFNKDYTASSDAKGVLTFGQYAPCLRGLAFAATSGASSGSAVSCIVPGPVTQNGRPEISNCEFSLQDHVNYNLYVNGLGATSGGTGYRTFYLHNCLFFGTAAASVWLGGVKYVDAAACQIGISGGSGTLALQMSGAPAVLCERMNWNGAYIDGDVHIDHATNGVIKANCTGDVTLGTSVTNFGIDGDIGGVFANNGVGNWHRHGA